VSRPSWPAKASSHHGQSPAWTPWTPAAAKTAAGASANQASHSPTKTGDVPAPQRDVDRAAEDQRGGDERRDRGRGQEEQHRHDDELRRNREARGEHELDARHRREGHDEHRREPGRDRAGRRERQQRRRGKDEAGRKGHHAQALGRAKPLEHAVARQLVRPIDVGRDGDEAQTAAERGEATHARVIGRSAA